MTLELPSPYNSPIHYLTVGLVIGAAIVGSIWFITSGPDRVVRNVKVNYMYQTNSNSSSGSHDVPVDSIEFYPRYIIVTRDNGYSNVFAIDRLTRFSFSPVVSK